MIKSKKQMFIVIGAFALVMLLSTVTYAFFNYTRTGSTNTIRVGRISFISKNEHTINLSNLFPIDPTDTNVMNDSTKVGTYSIEIKGDTDYADGLEYLVSAVDSNIYTSTGKTVPISLDIEVDDLGTESANYFTARESKNTTIYKKIVGSELVGDGMLLVGYIKPNTTPGTALGVDGSITIKAYLDKNNILISDTYDGTESDNMGTPNSMAEGKTVLTTSEWNAFQNSGASFKVKVEANEGIWVTGSLEEIMRMNNIGIDTENGVDFSKTSDQDNTLGVYMRAGTQNDDNPILYYRGAVEDNNVSFNNKCWKAVRTTDTGGVKLIYNGEINKEYERTTKGLSAYRNINKINDVEDVIDIFRFDSSDNTWNIELKGSSLNEFEFSVPSGDDYNLVMTGTSGSSCGGTMTFYKDDVSVISTSNGGGAAMNLSYAYGSLTSTNRIKMTYNGSSSASCPITFKIKMEQNSAALGNDQYTILKNDGYISSQKWTFDEEQNKWYAIVPYGGKVKISFSIADEGEYELSFSSFSGPIYVKSGDSNLHYDGSKSDLGNVTSSDVFSVEAEQMSIFSGELAFSLVSKKYTGYNCDNSGARTQIGTTAYNSSRNSPAHNGYMYGTVYIYNSGAATSGAYFGSSFTWDGTKYKLVNAVTTKNNTHHYTCNLTSANGTCTTLRYYYYQDYYINLTGGDSVEKAIEKMQQNINNSTAKNRIDTWYQNNMTGVTNKLEDTVWCNDRSFGDGNNSGWIANGGNLNTYLFYGPKERSNYAQNTSTMKNKPTLICKNKNDAFTVNSGKGNQNLTYPVALLTSDEMILAGGLDETSSSFYLSSGNAYSWAMSPFYFSFDYADEFYEGHGIVKGNGVVDTRGLRPAISLKPGTPIISGSGTVAEPYLIG